MLEHGNRTVADTEVSLQVRVSTVFLGTNIGTDRQPRYYDTRILGGSLDDDSTLSETYHEASIRHDIAVQRARVAAGRE